MYLNFKVELYNLVRSIVLSARFKLTSASRFGLLCLRSLVALSKLRNIHVGETHYSMS